jgi:hypothetical protein
MSVPARHTNPISKLNQQQATGAMATHFELSDNHIQKSPAVFLLTDIGIWATTQKFEHLLPLLVRKFMSVHFTIITLN